MVDRKLYVIVIVIGISARPNTTNISEIAIKGNQSPFAQGNISQILGEKMTAQQFALQTETQSDKSMQMVTQPV